MDRDPHGPTLEIDGVIWTRVETLADSGPADRHYVLSVDPDTGAASLRFGDGSSGALLPVGTDVTATYQSGSGASGNQPADGAIGLIEALAAAADILADVQDRLAEEAYLPTTRVRRSRRRRHPGDGT